MLSYKTKKMKRIGIYTLGLMFVLLFSQCGPTKEEDAINYNDQIISEQLGVINSINDLTNAVATYDSKQIEEALNAAKTQVEKSILALDKIGGFDDDTIFVDECRTFFKVLESQINSEYTEQFEIYAERDAGNYTDEDITRIKELYELIDSVYYPANERFTKVQKDFSEKWAYDLKTK